MSNEINIEELERLAKELINSAPWTSQHRDLSIVFAVTMSPDGVLSLIDRLKKAEAEVEQFRTDARRFRLAEKNLFDVQEAAKIIAKQAIAAEAERDALAAKLAELDGQEPVAWMGFGPRDGRAEFSIKKPAGSVMRDFNMRPVFARPAPAEMSPEFTDTARSALLWVLWHHQGGSSPVGQPIRYALGMDAHERLSEHQVQEAKRWAALTKSESTDFRQARTAPPEPVNSRLVDIARRTVGMIENTSIEAGFCCCGEGMDGHASAMTCGHSATDQGAYLANELHKDALEAIAAAEAQQAELVDERVIDRTWVRFCGAFGDGPDAPYPGMIASFEIHYGQSFRNKEWRTEAACWAAAWSKATARAEASLAEPQPDADGWINPNDKTRKQYLPRIGEKVLFCHSGVTYYGKHTGGSFQSFNPPRLFETWICLWMYPPKAWEAQP